MSDARAPSAATPAATRSRRACAAVALALLAIGVASRLLPLLDPGGRLLQQFPTEDGYLMLTIARNVAAGHGMSTAAGSLPTNGTQPLTTFVWAACFWLVNGDKVSGVLLVLLAEFLLACGGALLLFRISRRILRRRPAGDAVAALAAAAWFASPVAVRHSMNCLESGLYALTALLVAHAVLLPESDGRGASSQVRWVGIGALLGLCFWARNVAIWLCVAVGLTHLSGLLPGWPVPFGQRVRQLAAAGSTTLAVAAPWLGYNFARFGSIVPISGRAEALDAGFGANLSRLPAALFEYLALFLPIPAAWEQNFAVIVVCGSAVLAVVVGTLAASRRWRPEPRALFVLVGIYAASLCAFYGLAFGAGHFVSRYLFPISAFAALLWAVALDALWERYGDVLPRWSRLAPPALLVLLALALNVRLYLQGTRHLHFQVVSWVESHVPDEAWVGAIQTGTLGFFHDRTINLDGKVNPEALRARQEHGVPRYVVEKQIEYLADWVGIAGWIEHPDIARHFDVVVKDPRRNLAVLRRHGALAGARGEVRGS